MDLNKNYYGILFVEKNASEKEIRKAYYKLSFEYHPDRNRDVDPIKFSSITEAYDILSSEQRSDYDKRSKWGSSYDESTELLDFEFSNNAKGWDESKLESWISQNQLNILIYIDDDFNGSIEYERYVSCKKCGGDGKDTDSKIQIKDENGNVIKLFDGSDGCDFCDGVGKDWKGESCYFCGGKGKVGFTDCKSCNGEKRILGKQKLTGIKFIKGDKSLKIESMGHTSKDERGKYGSVFLIRKTN
jgi:DnaJ-class molecular chaperone